MKNRQNFYTRRSILIIGAVASALFISVNVLTVTFIHLNKKQNNSKATTQSESKIDHAINRSLDYTNQNVAQFHDSQKLFLHYLHRKFELEQKLPKEVIGSNLQFRTVARQEIDFMYRIVDPDKAVLPPLPENLPDINLVNIYSANCDIIPVPKNFWAMLQQQADKGGYEMTHVGLALEFIKGNGCEQPAVALALREQVTKGMTLLVEDPATSADLRYESVSFLLLMGRIDLIKPQIIDTIVDEQLDSGGWSDQLGSKVPNDHATVLALWALLEYAHPERSSEPLIRRPTERL